MMKPSAETSAWLTRLGSDRVTTWLDFMASAATMFARAVLE